MLRRALPLTFLTAVACAPAQAGLVLFDFEAEDDLAAWTIRSATQDTLQLTTEFATSGERAAVFSTPAWREGMEQWPAFEAAPPEPDWRAYDRLAVDLTNPTDALQTLHLLVSDHVLPFREGLSATFALEPRAMRRAVVDLGGLPPAVDRSRIAIVHFFTERPVAEMRVHLDAIRLLTPGEEPPPLPPAAVARLGGLLLSALADAEAVLEQAETGLAELSNTQALRDRAAERIAGIRASFEPLREALEGGAVTEGELAEARTRLARLPRLCERLVSEHKLRRQSADHGRPIDGMLVGLATSMEKILPRDMPFDLSVSDTAAVGLARNEKESFQLAVLADGRDLNGVRVTASDLTTEGGDMLAAGQIECDVVGYVETRTAPPYPVSYIGWWPDPILDFLDAVDIADGDLQTFWVRVRAPKDQPAGVYRGTLRVEADGESPLEIPLSVTVRTFTLPDHTPLPTAITFFEHPAQMGGTENWDRMKLVYADFLADYYIDYDSLYRQGPPDFEIVRHLHDQGKLVAFNLGNVLNAGTSDENFEAALAETIEQIRPGYEEAKRRGLLDHAYIYGFDERPEEQFGYLERSAQALREAFPEVVLMTTSYDHSYGLESVVKTIDAWCPLTPSFDPEKATQARAEGRYVWWYICCGPHNPYANWFVEYAAIESRLLMGAMAAKMRPDGFLYYSLTIWNDNKPIETGPFTEWNPVSWTVYHGDGSLFCAGPGGQPCPTIRLENYRDGQEDYAYACILEEAIRQMEAKAMRSAEQVAWLAEAKEALIVPEDLVATMAEYSHDPAALYAYRDRLGELIDRSGLTDLDPWGADYGVRGFGR